MISPIVLEAQHLTKRYGSLVAVEDLSLEVCEGEIFGFLGPNGAGKTTSINMMCGLLRPDGGRVLIHGTPLLGGSAAVRARVGVCPQNTVLWQKLTCLEQLEFVGAMYGLPGRIARRRGMELLESLDLAGQRNRLAGVLSGGMQRRLNLALALVNDPEILVLDEPEAGLDPQSRVLVRDYFRSLARRKTIILTTHNMDEADRLADRVAIIDRGRLLVVDTPERLKRTVGEGDVLEIDIEDSPVEQAVQAAARIEPFVSSKNNTLLIRAKGAVERLAEIHAALRQAGFRTGEVRLRANSLEDVFIQLTGRRLRE